MGQETRLKGPSAASTPASIAAAKVERRKISTGDFMKALRRAVPSKSEHYFSRLAKVGDFPGIFVLSLRYESSHCILEFYLNMTICRTRQALSLEVKANRGVDYEALLGVSELSLLPAPVGADPTGAPVLKRRSAFMELLHLQHFSECVEYSGSVLQCIDAAYKTYAADQAEVKAQARAEEDSLASNARFNPQASSARIASTQASSARFQSNASSARFVPQASNAKFAPQASSAKFASRAVLTASAESHSGEGDAAAALSSADVTAMDIPSLPLGLVRQAVLKSDSNKTRSEINRLLSYCCKLTVEETLLLEARRTPFPVEEIKSRIRMKIVKKSPPIS